MRYTNKIMKLNLLSEGYKNSGIPGPAYMFSGDWGTWKCSHISYLRDDTIEYYYKECIKNGYVQDEQDFIDKAVKAGGECWRPFLEKCLLSFQASSNIRLPNAAGMKNMPPLEYTDDLDDMDNDLDLGPQGPLIPESLNRARIRRMVIKTLNEMYRR